MFFQNKISIPSGVEQLLDVFLESSLVIQMSFSEHLYVRLFHNLKGEGGGNFFNWICCSIEVTTTILGVWECVV